MKRTGEWGYFFPAKLSCFGYNETTANLYFPLTREQAIQRGFNWQDEDPVNTVSQRYEIPDDVVDVGDDILQEILQCLSCKKNFKIVAQELNWYRKQKVAVPRHCVECRLNMRANMRTPRRLTERQCVDCGEKLDSPYTSERAASVYCENCYLKVVY